MPGGSRRWARPDRAIAVDLVWHNELPEGARGNDANFHANRLELPGAHPLLSVTAHALSKVAPYGSQAPPPDRRDRGGGGAPRHDGVQQLVERGLGDDPAFRRVG